jgi:hypothetical protein
LSEYFVDDVVVDGSYLPTEPTTKVIEDAAGGDTGHTPQKSRSRGAPGLADLARLMKKA